MGALRHSNESMSAIPFVIVADLRTGSTLLSSSLDQHPNIRCYGELLHPDDLPDNQPSECDRREWTGRELIRCAFTTEDVQAVGFRAMIFLPLPSQPQWADAWEYLRSLGELRVIYLMRHDRLAQYASVRIAQQAGAYHPSLSDPILTPEDRPTVAVDPEALRGWVEQRDHLFARRQEQLYEKPFLEVYYEDLTAHWSNRIRRVQAFLGVEPVALAPAKRKQEVRSLAEVITNYDQLRK
jgi:LPS sulfotransferase NodH